MDIEKVRDKIRKLLELSKSSNEHEAATAAARAAELMLKHQVSEAELDTTETADEAIERLSLEKDGYKAPMSWRGQLAVAVARALGCRVYYERDGVRKRLTVLGATADTQTVKYLYQYLVRELERLAAEKSEQDCQVGHLGSAAKKAAAKNRWRNSFRLGAIGVIADRLSTQRTETMGTASPKALIVIDRKKAAVDAAFASMGTRQGKASSARIDGSAYASGRQAGKNVALGGGKGLGGGSKKLGKAAHRLGSGK